MSTAISGVLGTVKSGAVDLDVSGFSFDYEVETFDSTTTADGGWSDETGAAKKISGSFDFFYNTSKKPTGASANLIPGATPTLYLQATTGEVFSGLGLITKLSLKSKVKDGVTVTASFTNKGVWTTPT
jgi:hypothetical protein